MNAMTQQRKYAVELLSATASEEQFFNTLKDLYQDIGCGDGLSFADISAYWRGDAPLPQAWGQALAQHAFKYKSDRLYLHGAWADEVKQAHEWMFTSTDACDWLQRSERMAALCCPFFDVAALGTWCVAKPDYTEPTLPKSNYLNKLLDAMQPWAQALAAGDDEWQALHAQLTSVQANPGLLSELLSEAKPDDHNVDYNGEATNELSWFIAYFAVMRLLCAQSNAGQQFAVNYPAIANGRGVHHRGNLWQREQWFVLHENYHRPINHAFAQHDDLTLLPDNARHHRFNDWCNGVGLVEAWMGSADEFRIWLLKLPEEFRLHWLSDTIQERNPDCALVFEQFKYRKNGSCAAQLSSPEALDWYRSILSKLEPEYFKKVLGQLSEHIDEAELLSLVWQHIRNEEQVEYRLLRGVKNAAELLKLVQEHPEDEVRRNAAAELNRLAWLDEDDAESLDAKERRHPEIWPLLKQACEQHPHIVVDRLYNADAELWGTVWDRADAAPMEGENLSSRHRRRGGGETRGTLVSSFMDRLDYREPIDQALFDLAGQWYQSEPERFQEVIEEGYRDDYESTIASIGRYPESPLMELVPDLAARTLSQGSGWFYREEHNVDGNVVDEALARYPEQFDALDNRKRCKVLQAMEKKALLACSATLGKLFASKQKTIRKPSLEFVARISPAAIQESGLLQSKNAKTRNLILTGLALNPAPEALPIIREFIDDKAHDEASRDLCLDALENGGESISDLDPWAELSLEALQALAQDQKVPAAVSKQWSADIADLLAPLGDDLAQYLLTILASDDAEQLPRRARKILSFVNAGTRADFALYGVNQWVAANGAAEVTWFTRAVANYADERVVNELVKAVKAWKKQRKVKANDAIRLIGRMPGIFGLAQVRELWESRGFSPSIVDTCQQTLQAAADKRGLSLPDFLDQLVPSFGLTKEGLVLDVGPYQYTAKIGPDLALVVVGPKGKSTKSLPKAKADEDTDLRSQAELKFKALKKNLKPVLTQQGKRLTEALHIGKTYPRAHWQRMFVEHPLLSIVGSRIVFNAMDAEGNILLQLRPSDDGALLDLNDDEIQLPEATASLRICHPLDITADDREAWKEHFEDYQIPSPIDQWNAPIVEANEEEAKADRILRHDGQVITHASLAGLLKKWGYQKGEAGDGARISEHTLKLDRGHWLITLSHDGMSVFFDAEEPVTLESFDIRCRSINDPERKADDDDEGERWWHKKSLGLSELPASLRALLLSQAQALKDAAGVS